MKIILHGGFTSIPNDLNSGYYAECTKDLKEGANILLVYFAREPKDINRCFEKDRELIQKYAHGKEFEFTVATDDGFDEQVRKADVIYLDGGNTDWLLSALKKHPSFIENIQDKVVVGTSAGAYVLSAYYHSASKGEVGQGLGVLPIRTVCHYQSDRFEDRGNPIEELDKFPHEYELVVLRDFEWRVFKV